MFADSFELDPENYVDVFSTYDNCKSGARDIVNRISSPDMLNRMRNELKYKKGKCTVIFDIIRNWKNRFDLEHPEMMLANTALDSDDLICVRIEEKGAFTDSGVFGKRMTYKTLDYAGVKDELAGNVLKLNEDKLVYMFCFPSTEAYAKRVPTYAIVFKSELEKALFDAMINGEKLQKNHRCLKKTTK